MHHRISTLLRALRQDLAARLGDDVIRAACRAAGHIWCDSCLLTPAAIIHWFLIQVLHGNTALTHVSLLAGRAFSAGAFCQARARLPLAVFRALLRDMVRAVIPDTEAIGRWRGHRTFLVDGSSFSMPDTPALQAHFGRPGNQAKGCGFPAAHLLALFHAGTGLLLEVAAAPLRTSDFAGLADVLALLRAGDVLVADRGFCSFAAQRASDRVASGRCRPEAPTDPYVLALEHTVPQIRDSLPDVSRTNGTHPRQRVTPEQEAETGPGHRALTTAAEKPLMPATLDFPEEPRERSRVARHTVIRVMSA